MLSCAVLAAAIGGGIGTAAADPPAVPDPIPSGTTQVVFTDTFDGTGSLDTDRWLYTQGTAYPGGPAGFGTGEIETNTADPRNVRVQDGNLVITPQRDGAGHWTSARVETKAQDFKPPPGKIMTSQARLQFPNVTGDKAKGYWPAFWMLGSPSRTDRWSWPAVGEFDIAENVNGLPWSYGVLHCGVAAQWGGPCNEPSGINTGEVPVNGQAGFHTYTVVWDRTSGDGADQLRWSIDGQLTQTVNQSQIPAGVWSSMTGHDGYYGIFNVAINGAFPQNKTGDATAATEPGHPMLVDYFTVTYSGNAAPATSTSVPTTTTTATTTPTTATTATTAPTSTAPGTTGPVTGPVATPTCQGTSTTPTGSPTSSGLRVLDNTATAQTLAWDTVPGAARYGLLRAGIQIGTTTETSIVDGGLMSTTAYNHSVRAYTADGTALSTTTEITTTTT